MSRRGQRALRNNLLAMLDYHMAEYILTPIEMIGALETVKAELLNDACDVAHLSDLEIDEEGDGEQQDCPASPE